MHDLDRTLLEISETDEAQGGLSYEMEDDAFEADLESEAEDSDEMELTDEALAISDEAELENFLGNLVKNAARRANKALRSSTMRPLIGILKNAAKKTLPLAGTAIGAAIGGPVGARLGGTVAAGAGQLLGLELEGLSPQDQQYETARQFVRFARAAANNAVRAASSTVPPMQAAVSAVTKAAQTYAPGLLRAATTTNGHGGRWVRRGKVIVLYGA